MVHAKKEGRGGKQTHCVNEVNDVQTIRNSFPFVLLFGMNFMNFMNFRLESSTYNVNAEKQNMNFMNFRLESNTYARTAHSWTEWTRWTKFNGVITKRTRWTK
jgi:hypothetical protein